ncbi:MAG: hypothetical protein E7C35_22780 [Enterobacter hormaechei]|nr:hypothetical protein [Enterobacter hormaechei]
MRPLMPPVQTPDNLFHDGNPLTGELGTIVDAEHLNNVQGTVRDTQSELLTILASAGINVDPTKQNQLLTALKALLLSRSNPFGDIKTDGAPAIAKALSNLGLSDTVDKAEGAVQKTGDEMSGKLTLPQTSSFGVNVNNNIGGSSAISTGNATEGAGGFGSQLTSGAPFYSPAIVRQNNDNNYFPLWKQIVSLQSGYPVAASMGLLTTGEPNFPQIVLHAKTDFEVNDKFWVFDVATGELRSPALIKAGEAVLNTNGDISGSAWGGALTNWLNSQFATRDTNINARATVDWVNSQFATRDANINARATVDWVNSQFATRDANINARATVDWVNSNFNKKNTATLGFSGWSRDESTGLIMQWGNVDNARGTYSFPRAFNDTCFAVFATNKDGQGGAIDNAYGYPVSKTQFYLASKANSGADTAYGISWFALGY